MNSKHFAAGSEFPVPEQGKLRIYNCRFCYYGQRVVLVAEAKGIEYDLVNCNLKPTRKPEWLVERNPSGRVPVIDTPQGPLYESLIVSDYLDEVFPGRRLTSTDPFQKAWDRVLVENFAKVASLYHRMLFEGDNTELVKSLLVDFIQALVPFEAELKKRGTVFYGGNDNPGMLDYMIWPWFERFPVLKISFASIFDFETARQQIPLLVEWRQAMLKDPAVDAVLVPVDSHLKFNRNFVASVLASDDSLDYDCYD